MPLPYLPIGLSEFADIRQHRYVYVDKTESIHPLVTVPKRSYFFSRPRRFGKSLLISTLQALFAGRRELFDGLWIAQKGRWDWSQQHPVIRLDMSLASSETPQTLKEGLASLMRGIIRKNRLSVDLQQHPAILLRESIEELAQQNSVVVLVDEYDKPLVNHLGGETKQQRAQQLDIANANRQVLRDFYTVLKGQSSDLRLVFVTGVSKFAKVSIFSGLNNLTDLTLDRQCACLAGYTQQELETNFAPHLQHLANERQQSLPQLLDEMKNWYNGFQFSSANLQVYNPFSTLLLLEQQEFRSHWFQTATPTFFTHLIKRSEDLQPNELTGAAVSESTFDSYEIMQLHENILPLMVQTGYLTLRGYDAATCTYTLDYPNKEVRNAFTESLLQSYTHLAKGKAVSDVMKLRNALQQADLPSYFVTLRRILAGISYELHISLERYYQTVFYLIHQLLGYQVYTEVHTNTGRIDAVIDLDNHTYIFEFKLELGNPTPKHQLAKDSDTLAQFKSPVHQDQLAAQLADSHNQLAQAALQQINERRYHTKYLGRGKPITLIGAVFTVNTPQGKPVRQVTAWVREDIDETNSNMAE
ncbi:MAG: AAA family ATPase [Myxococcota bacterium]